jgi:hypothetical protein
LTKEKLDIAALSPGDLATLLSQSLRRPITEEQVREIAESGDLLSENQSINLVKFTAFLAGQVNYGNN